MAQADVLTPAGEVRTRQGTFPSAGTSGSPAVETPASVTASDFNEPRRNIADRLRSIDLRSASGAGRSDFVDLPALSASFQERTSG